MRDLARHIRRRRQHARLEGRPFTFGEAVEAMQGPLGVDRVDTRGRLVHRRRQSDVER